MDTDLANAAYILWFNMIVISSPPPPLFVTISKIDVQQHVYGFADREKHHRQNDCRQYRDK